MVPMNDTKHVVSTYLKSWSSGTLDRDNARAMLADDIDFRGPLNTFTSADQVVAGLEHFAPTIERVEMIDELVVDDRAFSLFDVHFKGPMPPARFAEHFVVRDGKITRIRLVFDATEIRKG